MYAITLICSYFRVNNTNTTNKTKHVMKKKIDLRKLLSIKYICALALIGMDACQMMKMQR